MNQTMMKSHLKRSLRRNRNLSKMLISGLTSPKVDGQWSKRRRLSWLQPSNKVCKKK